MSDFAAGSASDARSSLVLIAARESELRDLFASLLESDFNCCFASSAHEGERELSKGGVAVVLCSDQLADMSGLEWFSRLRRRREVAAVRVFAPADSSEDLAIKAINRGGVFRYVRDFASRGQLQKAVGEALEISGHRAGPACMREAVAGAIRAHSLCRNSKTGCLAVGQEKIKECSPYSILSLAGWGGMVILGLGMLAAVLFLLGAGTILILYLFKTLLGINLVEGWHLSDWFK